MSTNQSSQILVVMITKDVYYIGEDDATKLMDAMTLKQPIFPFVDSKNGNDIVLQVQHVVAIVATGSQK